MEEIKFDANAFADLMIERFQKNLKRYNVGWTKQLEESFVKKIMFESGGMPSKFIFTFLQYARMVDMGVGKGVKVEDAVSNSAVWSHAGVKRTRRRKPFIGKTHAHQTHRLNELLAEAFSKVGKLYLDNILNPQDVPLKINIEI